jgi:hypothetical protein
MLQLNVPTLAMVGYTHDFVAWFHSRVSRFPLAEFQPDCAVPVTFAPVFHLTLEFAVWNA